MEYKTFKHSQNKIKSYHEFIFVSFFDSFMQCNNSYFLPFATLNKSKKKNKKKSEIANYLKLNK